MIKNPQQNPGADPLASKSHGWDTIRDSGLAMEQWGLVGLSASLADLERGFQTGNYTQVEEGLRNLLSRQQLFTRQVTPGSRASAKLFLSFARGWTLLGRNHLELENFEKSQEDFKRAIDLFNQGLQVGEPSGQDLCNYGIALHSVGRTREASDYLNKAASLGTFSADGYLYLGLNNLELDLGGQAEVEGLLRKSLELNPKNCKARQVLAEIIEGQKPLEAVELYHEGAVHLAIAGRPAKALNLLESGLKLNPQDPHLWTSKGEILRVMDRKTEAEEALRKAVELDPDLPWAYAGLGEVLRLQGRHDEALTAVNRALTLMPDNPLALEAKGEILLALNRKEEAVDVLKDFVRVEPNNAWGLASLGQVLHCLKRNDEALAAVDRALDLVKDDAFALAVKGRVYKGLGRNQDAVSALRQAVKIDPQLAWAYDELSDALRLLGDNYGALNVVNQALHLDPDNPLTLGTKSEVLRALNRHEEAVEVLQRAVELDPNYAWGQAHLGEALRLLKRYSEALTAVNRALDLDQNYAWAWTVKGHIYKDRGQNEEAEAPLQRAVELDSELAWAHLGLAETLLALRRSEEALRAVARALELVKDDAFALAVKGQAYKDLGQYDKAVNALNQAVERDPDMAWAYGELGDALRLQGRYEEALKVTEKLLRVEPDNPWAWGVKGAALASWGRHDEALAALQKALNIKPNYSFVLGVKGIILQILQRFDEAAEAFSKALEFNPPDKGWLLEGLAQVLIENDEYERALTVIEEWLIVSPEDSKASQKKANVLISMARYPEVIDFLDEVIATRESESELYYLKGWALEQQKKPEAALEAYRKAHGLNGENPWYLRGIAGTVSLLEGVEKGDLYYKKAIEKARSLSQLDARTVNLMGWCYYCLRQYDEAVPLLIDALSKNSRLISAQFELALALLCSGSHILALVEYKRGIEMAQTKPEGQRQGLLSVALNDLKEAQQLQHLKQALRVTESEQMLQDALDAVQNTRVNATT